MLKLIDDARRLSIPSSDEILRKAGLGGVLGTAQPGAVADLLGGVTRTPFLDRIMREVAEAGGGLARLVSGATGRTAAATEAERATERRQGVRALSTGGAVAQAMRETYAILDGSASRDLVLGRVAGAGSLASVAAALAEPGSTVGARAGAAMLETRELLFRGERSRTIDGALRAGYGDLFPAMRRPRAAEIEAVIAGGVRPDNLKPYPDWAAEARASFEAMTVAWVREDVPDASLAAMTRLTELDRLVADRPPAALQVVEALRDRLGDYRGAPAPEQGSLQDPIARTGYQLERGLDPVLTVLPTAVLAAMFAPLRRAAPDAEADPDQLENAVRMMLKRLEHALRRFLASKLREMDGEQWFEALPSDIRRAWTRGRQRAVEAGRRPDELIAYADMDHYRQIIEHPERWERLFKSVFGDREAIRETLRRIGVIRNDGAHFRTVTLEDLIVLRAEGVHLARWLGIRLGD